MIVETTTQIISGVVSLGVIAAYIGLGSGLASIGALLAVGGTAIVMLVGLVWYPIKQVLRKWRARRANENPADEPPAPTG